MTTGSDALYHRLFSHPLMVEQLVRQAIEGTKVPMAVPEELGEMRTMLASLGQRWAEKWRAEAIAEGVAEGLAKGMSKGLSKGLIKGRAKGRAEGKAEGRAEGRAEGKAEGRAEGKAQTLLRLLDRRFGPVPDAMQERVRAADLDTLDLWLDRVLDAATLDAVFEETPP